MVVYIYGNHKQWWLMIMFPPTNLLKTHHFEVYLPCSLSATLKCYATSKAKHLEWKLMIVTLDIIHILGIIIPTD